MRDTLDVDRTRGHRGRVSIRGERAVLVDEAPSASKPRHRRPCLGDFQKVWDTECAAIGMAGRIPHDLRRSGVKHYIDAGVDPHTVMAWSGHCTPAMLRRYHIIDLDDLRRAGKSPRTVPDRRKFKDCLSAVVELSEC